MSTNPRVRLHAPARRIPSLDQAIMALEDATPGTWNWILCKLLKRELENSSRPRFWRRNDDAAEVW